MRMAMKLAAMLLTLCMIVVMVIGCSGGNSTPTSTDTPSATATPQAGEPDSGNERNIVENPDNLFVEKPMDLGGRTIKIGSPWDGDYKYEDIKEETPSFTIKRLEILKSIEEDYNCKIEYVDLTNIEFGTQEMAEQLALSKSSGDVYVDILDHQSDFNPGTALAREYLYPLFDIDVISSQDESVWSSITKGSEYKGKIYGLNTELGFGMLRTMLLYNKKLAAQYGVENLYDLVRNKEWTFDKFLDVSESVYDKSGGTVSSIVTLYGMPGKLYEQFMTSNNAVPFEASPTGLINNIDSEKGLQACQFFTDLIGKGLFDMTVVESTDEDPAFNYFINGKSMFFTAEGWMIGWVFEEMEDEFGIIPMPLGPDATEYASLYDIGRYWSIVDNGGNMEEVGAVLIALAKRTNDYYPDIDEYEPMTWQEDLVGSSWDEESVEMSQIMIDNMVMNQVNQLTEVPGWDEACLKMAKGELTPKEAIAGISQSIQAVVDEANK